MPDKKSIYNYDNPKFAGLRQPMRDVMGAYGNAERFFADIKEKTWLNFGLKYLTLEIHALEHIQPERVDIFKDILAQVGLPVEYPAVPELSEELTDIDKVFEVCIGIIDEIDESIERFVKYASDNGFGALARQAEQLQIDNSFDKALLLEAWNMFPNAGCLATFDLWCEELFEVETE